MEQGKTEKVILKQCRDSGRPVPDSIRNAPTLLPGLEYYYSIWWELQSDRPMGFSAGMIPSAAIRSWIKDHGMDPEEEDAEDIVFVISQMDVEWLKWNHKKSEKAESLKRVQQQTKGK